MVPSGIGDMKSSLRWENRLDRSKHQRSPGAIWTIWTYIKYINDLNPIIWRRPFLAK